MSLNVIKRDGSKEPLNIEKIHKVVFWATEGLSGVSASEVEIKSQIQFYNNIESKKIHETIIKAASELISEEATNYQFVAGRLINYQLRKEVYGQYEPFHVLDLIKKNVDLGFYDEALLSEYTEEEWNQINGFINHSRDMKLAYAAMEQLRGKYLVKNRVTGQIYETPQMCYILIAATLFSKYPKETRLQYVKDYYDMVSKHYISLPTPIMAGVRTPERQFSSCFPAGQMVQTKQGLKPIESVSVGELVLTRSGAYQPVLATREKENLEKFVNFSHNTYFDDSFTSTEGHEIFALRKFNDASRKKWNVPEWVKASDLNSGDYVHIPVNKDITPLTKICISDFVDLTVLGYEIDEEDGFIKKLVSNPARYQGRKYAENVTSIKNEIELNEDFYRLMGYYLAEGHTHADFRGVYWTFGTSEKSSWIADTKNIIETILGYHPSVEEKKDHSSVVKINSVVFAHFMMAICGTGFAHKKMHDILLKGTVSNQKALITGIIRGDGCVHSNGCMIGLSNKNLAYQIAHIMIRSGLYPSLSHRLPSGKATGNIKRFSSVNTSYQINLASGPNYEFIVSIGKNADKIVKRQGNHYGISKFLNGEFFTRIRNHSVSENAPSELVYDLQVDNDQSFTVAGVCVHNCVLIESDDSLDSITATSKAIVSYVSKKAGIGIGAGRIRAIGSPVRKGDTSHTGVTPFYRYFQTSVRSCSQGGVRNGAATLYVPIFHLEIEDIIVLKNNKGVEENRVRHMDYGVQLNKLFYERLITGGNITLFSPSDIKEAYEAFFTDYDRFKELYERAERNTRIRKKVISAVELFTYLMQERKDTGRIYIQNVDNCNTHSSFIEKEAPIRQSNLCAEVTLHTRPMGSIKTVTYSVEDNDLSARVAAWVHDGGMIKNVVPKRVGFTNEDGSGYFKNMFDVTVDEEDSRIALCTLSAINWGKIKTPSDFEKPCRLAVRALDALLDYQHYPVVAARLSTMEHRPVGIGIINFAYWLASNGLKYTDDSALPMVDEFAEAWSYYLIKASVELAKEKGACTRVDQTKYGLGIMPIDTRKLDVDELVPHVERMPWAELREDAKLYGIRNATLMALMPAETSAQIANATNGIEPPRAFVSIKQSKDGVLAQVVPKFEKLKNKYELLWDQKSPIGYLKICAILQKYIDQAISVNTSYNPKFYPGEQIPMSELMQHLLLFYKWGGKNLYYQNTNDQAGEVDVHKTDLAPIEEADCDSCKL